MWEERAYRARRDIAELAASGLGVSDLHAAAISLIDDKVGTDLTCWATIDPEMLVISMMTSGQAQVPAEYEPFLAQSETSADEPHRFATLVLRKESMAKLSDLADRDRNRSLRFNNVWRPLGIDQSSACCSWLTVRVGPLPAWYGQGHDFTDRETDFLAAVAPAIASATRLAVRSEAPPDARWPARDRRRGSAR